MTSYRILIADDDRMLRALLAHKLKKIPSEVVEASDGQQALEILEREPIDLVVLDGMMPVMDGIETLQRIRADEKLKDLPVMMLTARRSEKDADVALRLGATDYISKPFNPEDLTIRIARFLASITLSQRKSA